MRSILLKIFAAIFFAGLFIQAGAPPRLQAEIDKLNADTVLLHGEWGLCVMTADSGKIIASNNPILSLIPASTMKIVTTGAAMGLLGPDFRYETKLEYDGNYDQKSGIIHGNIYIHGCGDPTFNSAHFNDTTASLHALFLKMQKAGIKKVDGNIIGDASCFSDNPIPDGWSWGDIGQYYGAGTCGLDYEDNSISLYFDSTNGDSVKLTKTNPVPENISYRSFVKADGKNDEALVYGAPYGNVFYIYGSIPAQKKKFTVQASNPDPAYQCVKDFKELLDSSGIAVAGKISTIRRMDLAGEKHDAKRNVLTSVFSPTLSEIVKQTCIHSDNVYAEQLLRTMGILKGESSKTEDGIEVVKNYWKSQGINLDGLNMTDGSGLSRSNLITTKIQASILQKIFTMSWYDAFFDALPVAGKSGSMASLCKGTCAENNMHAKTGYINRARGYAGYVKAKDGRTVCFSLLANNYTCSPTEMKKRLEKILVAIAEME